MSDISELYCTQDAETGEWHVWFTHPLGGMKVLETFNNQVDAQKFYQEQIDTKDF
jgi:hypothetical protein